MTTDLLTTITAAGLEARDITLEVESLELRIKELNAQLHVLTRETLPDLMSQAHLSKFTLEAQGNNPAYEITARPYIRANIAASWPAEKRAEAFQWLTENGHGDLISVTLVPDARGDTRGPARPDSRVMPRRALRREPLPPPVFAFSA
jgi:hypothetical protein